jgi:hypothetical protein
VLQDRHLDRDRAPTLAQQRAARGQHIAVQGAERVEAHLRGHHDIGMGHAHGQTPRGRIHEREQGPEVGRAGLGSQIRRHLEMSDRAVVQHRLGVDAQIVDVVLLRKEILQRR